MHCFLFLALRYRQDSYRHIIETVPSTNQPSRANQQYPPPNLWQPNDSTSQQQQIFMSGIQRPFPGLAPHVQQPVSSSSIAPLNNTNSMGIPGGPSSYLTNYSGLNSTANNTYLDDQTNLSRHFPNLDANLAPLDLGVPVQFQTTANSTNSFYPSQRTHTSPSSVVAAAAAFPPAFGYVPPSFNHHHHHHHHLSSNVDDANFLIQNPSLTWSLIFLRTRFVFLVFCFFVVFVRVGKRRETRQVRESETHAHIHTYLLIIYTYIRTCKRTSHHISTLVLAGCLLLFLLIYCQTVGFLLCCVQLAVIFFSHHRQQLFVFSSLSLSLSFLPFHAPSDPWRWKMWGGREHWSRRRRRFLGLFPLGSLFLLYFIVNRDYYWCLTMFVTRRPTEDHWRVSSRAKTNRSMQDTSVYDTGSKLRCPHIGLQVALSLSLFRSEWKSIAILINGRWSLVCAFISSFLFLFVSSFILSPPHSRVCTVLYDAFEVCACVCINNQFWIQASKRTTRSSDKKRDTGKHTNFAFFLSVLWRWEMS